ncbi:MAG: methyl-accepting chemotaxis protein [Clostridiales bacterium]|jgi:methyl-accepting chemotaxis protein|nr:methyl-accepting chemotaxis protein [Clostridiales bacterium]
MFKSLKSKLTVPIIGVLILVFTFIVVYVSISTANLTSDFSDERIEAASLSIGAYLDSMERQARLAAPAVANDAELIRLINAGDRDGILQHLLDIRSRLGVDDIILANSDGYGLARTIEGFHHIYGDQIGHVPNIAAALRGEYDAFFSTTPVVPIVLTSTAPVMDGDRLIGGVVVNFNIGTNVFLDELTEIFGIDGAVFVGNESVASTLIYPDTNERAIGINAPPHIAEAVLQRGQTQTLELDVFGVLPFSATYFPLRGIDNNPIGIFFVGIELSEAHEMTSALQRTMIIVGIIGVSISAGAIYLLTARTLKPLKGLAAGVKEASTGNLNVNISKNNLSKDEIGSLTGDVLDLVGVIKSMVEELSSIKLQYNTLGNIDYRIDAEKYQNSFRELVESINFIMDDEMANIRDVCRVLNSIGEGEFDIEIIEMPGELIMQAKAMYAVIANLKAVSTEINAMINAVANDGDLSFKIDANKYQGGWRDIMIGLNSISTAVEMPITVAEICMDEMQKGNFDLVKIDNTVAAMSYSANLDDYKGVFRRLLGGVDNTLIEVSSYIAEITDDLVAIAGGDLTQEITREYLGDFRIIKDSLNSISRRLNKTMSDISAASYQVLSGAKQISESAMDLADGASVQASSVEELNASIGMITDQTHKNAQNAAEANELSGRSAENAKEGNAAMEQMLKAMEQIKDASQNISAVVKVIQDIAFQTNLLALNASVEAARAGEHGKGFAVVAEEVRNLANRSQGAATETTELIEDSMNRVEAGSNIAESTSKSLDIIVKNAAEVLSIINSISEASKEQAEAIELISSGIGQISQVVQNNSAVSEETAAASQELSSQAELLQELVSYFKL